MDLSRLEILINDKVDILKKSCVLIIGLGGVGSYSTEALCRAGVGILKIVDFDTIDSSNLNRQLMTNINNIGLKKVDVFEDRIKNINPNCNVIKIDKKITIEDIKDLACDVDAVIDACDDIEIKKEVVRYCTKNKILFISSMGTGNKLDPTRLKIIDIRKTSYDPIAKIIRKMIRDEKINGKVMVVSSDEKSIVTNSNVIGSNSFVPATSGLFCASYIINKLIGDKNE